MKALKILSVFALAAAMLFSCTEWGDEDDTKSFNLDEFLARPSKLKANTYVIQKEGGKAETRNYVQKWSEWRNEPKTDPKTNQTTQYVNLNLEDADADGGTLGGAYFSLPESVIGKVQSITAEFFKENPWASVMAFTFKDPEAGHEAGEITAKSGGDNGEMFGNMKTDGTCKFLVQKSEGTKAYSGIYQVLFYFEFHNTLYVWNAEKGEYGGYDEIDDGNYIMYGNALVEEYVPPVTSFTLSPHEFYLGYGGAGQVLDVEYQPANAKWDWYDLEIGNNTESFIYYPETHIITINKQSQYADAHDLGIQVKFQLKSNPSVYDFVYVNKNQQPQKTYLCN